MFAELPISFEVNQLNCSGSTKTCLVGTDQRKYINRNSKHLCFYITWGFYMFIFSSFQH